MSGLYLLLHRPQAKYPTRRTGMPCPAVGMIWLLREIVDLPKPTQQSALRAGKKCWHSTKTKRKQKAKPEIEIGIVL